MPFSWRSGAQLTEVCLILRRRAHESCPLLVVLFPQVPTRIRTHASALPPTHGRFPGHTRSNFPSPHSDSNWFVNAANETVRCGNGVPVSESAVGSLFHKTANRPVPSAPAVFRSPAPRKCCWSNCAFSMEAAISFANCLMTVASCSGKPPGSKRSRMRFSNKGCSTGKSCSRLPQPDPKGLVHFANGCQSKHFS